MTFNEFMSLCVLICIVLFFVSGLYAIYKFLDPADPLSADKFGSDKFITHNKVNANLTKLNVYYKPSSKMVNLVLEDESVCMGLKFGEKDAYEFGNRVLVAHRDLINAKEERG